MIVRTLDEEVIRDIGHAFAYYDYGEERGIASAFSDKDAAALYICGYARGMLKGGFMRTTSEHGEGFIAYKLPGEKVSLSALGPIIKGFFRAMSLREMMNLLKAHKKGGIGLEDRMKKEKKLYIFVGMVCVREEYQRQGYMRRLMEMAYADGDRLGVPVILETDAMAKVDRYVHLGMELAGVRDFGEYGKLYDMIRYPAKTGK